MVATNIDNDNDNDNNYNNDNVVTSPNVTALSLSPSSILRIEGFWRFKVSSIILIHSAPIFPRSTLSLSISQN